MRDPRFSSMCIPHKKIILLLLVGPRTDDTRTVSGAASLAWLLRASWGQVSGEPDCEEPPPFSSKASPAYALLACWW